MPARRQRRSLRLRTRVTLLFLLSGLVAAVGLSVVSYLVARAYLLDRRDEVAERQAFNNAQLIRTQLKNRRGEAFELVSGVRTEPGGFAVLHLEPEDLFYSQDLRFTQTAFPDQLVNATISGRTGSQRFTLDGEPFVGIGVSIAEIDANYFEAFPMSSEQRTLRLIGSTLALGTAITTLLAAGLGWWVSRRLLRPLTRVADAASDIASGGLDTRMEPEADPDLERLAHSFNDMADTVQARIERETRFASDVSHELRSPITALTAAVEVLDARRADLPERSQQALDVVVSQVRRFDSMVMDLLELSRLDVGAGDLHREELAIADVVERIARRHGFAGVPVLVGHEGDRSVMVDKRRLERIVANLLDNARLHAGGPVAVTIDGAPDGSILLAVEDAGPGVSASEKAHIFERFARGTAGRSRAGGTGLGLALVREHARSHGGDAWVEDRSGGGARFVVRFPGSRR